MSTTSTVKKIKISDLTISINKVFSEEKLDKLGAEFSLHNFPKALSEQANIVLLQILTIKYFTDYPFQNNIAHQIAQYEQMLEDGIAQKIADSISKRELLKINKAIEKGTIHIKNLINYLADTNVDQINQLLRQGE